MGPAPSSPADRHPAAASPADADPIYQTLTKTVGFLAAFVVDFIGLLSWSAEAQAVLARATGQARLQGGRVAVFGLAPIPAWQAGGCDLRELDRALGHAAA
jgi:hypothetical protein